MIQMEDQQLTDAVLAAALEVHRTIGGPGLLESVYDAALAHELELRDIPVERQKLLPITYKGAVIAEPLRIDLWVDDQLIVEIKAVSQHNPVFESQLLTYLRQAKRPYGLLMNFGMPLLKDGIRRVINNRYNQDTGEN
jgi:GxxExxY protein